MKRILINIVDVLIPPRCHVCGEVLMPEERFICRPCLGRLPRTQYQHREGNPVEMRFAGKIPFERASGHFFYSRGSAVASLIHDFKYRNYPTLARQMGRLMAEDLFPSGFLNDLDCICPVPLHWIKRLQRGYNQTERIARGISDETGIKVSRDLVAARRHATQTGFTPEERVRNVEGIFILKNAEKYSGKHILLLDDVCTTGATLTSAADAILEAAPTSRLTLLALAATF